MFYVYLYRDPRPTKGRQPVYVGKGSGRRATLHWKYGNKVNRVFDAWLGAIRRLGLEPIIEIVAEFEIEAEAFEKEIELIALFGRKDTGTGPLCNCTDGGEGGSGKVVTEEQRKTMALAARTRKSAAYQTPEFKQVIGQITERNWATQEYREKTVAAMQAAAKSDGEKTRKSQATAAGWANSDTRAKRTASIKESRTPELRAQIGASCAALWDDDKRKEQSEKMKAVCADPRLREAKAAYLRANPMSPPKPVEATTPGGAQSDYPSVTMAMEQMRISETTLRRGLKGREITRGKFKGWKFRYLTSPKNPDTLPIPAHPDEGDRNGHRI